MDIRGVFGDNDVCFLSSLGIVKMNDPEIRKVFFEAHGYDRKSMGIIGGLQKNGDYVFQEMGISAGSVIADIVIIRGNHLHGIEIKGDNDSVSRLPAQIKAYQKVFHFCTALFGETDRLSSKADIPKEWGVAHVSESSGFLCKRIPKGMIPESSEIVKLLWRDEVYEVLKTIPGPDSSVVDDMFGGCQPRRTLSHRMSKATRGQMWRKLVDNIGINELTEIVIKKITERRGWK